MRCCSYRIRPFFGEKKHTTKNGCKGGRENVSLQRRFRGDFPQMPRNAEGPQRARAIIHFAKIGCREKGSSTCYGQLYLLLNHFSSLLKINDVRISSSENEQQYLHQYIYDVIEMISTYILSMSYDLKQGDKINIDFAKFGCKNQPKFNSKLKANFEGKWTMGNCTINLIF